MAGRRQPVVLMVAEKPAVAKGLAQLLSGHAAPASRQGQSPYNRIFELAGVEVGALGACALRITSVAGHLRELEFAAPFDKWSACAPDALFGCAVESRTPPDKLALERQLQVEARGADALMIWTDCDREGEAIGFEVIDVCVAARPLLAQPGRVRRARFSALIEAQVRDALRNPVPPDRRQAEAVRARSEIDLRLGAAFTRLQTTALQRRFDELATRVVSYGPCQMPTLGFVVDRYRLIEGFQAEHFWSIALALAVPLGADEAAAAAAAEAEAQAAAADGRGADEDAQHADEEGEDED